VLLPATRTDKPARAEAIRAPIVQIKTAIHRAFLPKVA
jgi:hypothetical protein